MKFSGSAENWRLLTQLLQISDNVECLKWLSNTVDCPICHQPACSWSTPTVQPGVASGDPFDVDPSSNTAACRCRRYCWSFSAGGARHVPAHHLSWSSHWQSCDSQSCDCRRLVQLFVATRLKTISNITPEPSEASTITGRQAIVVEIDKTSSFSSKMWPGSLAGGTLGFRRDWAGFRHMFYRTGQPIHCSRKLQSTFCQGHTLFRTGGLHTQTFDTFGTASTFYTHSVVINQQNFVDPQNEDTHTERGKHGCRPSENWNASLGPAEICFCLPAWICISKLTKILIGTKICFRIEASLHRICWSILKKITVTSKSLLFCPCANEKLLTNLRLWRLINSKLWLHNFRNFWSSNAIG